MPHSWMCLSLLSNQSREQLGSSLERFKEGKKINNTRGPETLVREEAQRRRLLHKPEGLKRLMLEGQKECEVEEAYHTTEY